MILHHVSVVSQKEGQNFTHHNDKSMSKHFNHSGLNVNPFIQDISQASMNISTLQGRINVSYERYRRQSDIYMEFLRSYRTKDSISDIEAPKEIYLRRQNLVDTSIKRIRDFCVSLSETTSMKSFRSKATTHHSRSDSGTQVQPDRNVPKQRQQRQKLLSLSNRHSLKNNKLQCKRTGTNGGEITC